MVRMPRLLAVASLLFASAALGQGAVGPPLLEFSFSNPGARSLGFGGTFVALADDATAAYSNPSGLTQLLDPEVSLELRSREYRTPFTESGRVTGPPTGIGIDTNPDLVFSESRNRTSDVSFFSYVHPGKGRWSVAAYRHQYANFESETRTQGLFGGDSCCGNRYHDIAEMTDLEVASYGISYGYRISDSVSVGLGLVYYSGRLSITTDIYAPDDDTLAAAFSPNSYLPGRRALVVETRASDDSVGLSAGFLWRRGPWQLGGAYRQGPSIRTVMTGIAGPVFAPEVPAGSELGVIRLEVRFPDVMSLGTSFRTKDGRMTLGVEWDRIGYSSYIRSVSQSSELDTSGMYIADANEIHLGAEYVFLSSRPLFAVRGGIWLDPDHRVRYDGEDPLTRAYFQRGDDALHYALGFGVVMKSVQLDVGVDLSDRGDTASLSAIYSF